MKSWPTSAYGEVLWEVEIEKVFGKGATTDLGWHFIYSEKLDLYVGSVGINPTNFAPDKVRGTDLLNEPARNHQNRGLPGLQRTGAVDGRRLAT